MKRYIIPMTGTLSMEEEQILCLSGGGNDITVKPNPDNGDGTNRAPGRYGQFDDEDDEDEDW